MSLKRGFNKKTLILILAVLFVLSFLMSALTSKALAVDYGDKVLKTTCTKIGGITSKNYKCTFTAYKNSPQAHYQVFANTASNAAGDKIGSNSKYQFYGSIVKTSPIEFLAEDFIYIKNDSNAPYVAVTGTISQQDLKPASVPSTTTSTPKNPPPTVVLSPPGNSTTNTTAPATSPAPSTTCEANPPDTFFPKVTVTVKNQWDNTYSFCAQNDYQKKAIDNLKKANGEADLIVYGSTVNPEFAGGETCTDGTATMSGVVFGNDYCFTMSFGITNKVLPNGSYMCNTRAPQIKLPKADKDLCGDPAVAGGTNTGGSPFVQSSATCVEKGTGNQADGYEYDCSWDLISGSSGLEYNLHGEQQTKSPVDIVLCTTTDNNKCTVKINNDTVKQAGFFPVVAPLALSSTYVVSNVPPTAPPGSGVSKTHCQDSYEITELISALPVGPFCWLLSGLVSFYKWLRGLVGEGMLAKVINITDIASNPMVVEVWGGIRNIINSFFVIVFLFGALATVLRFKIFEMWQLRRMVPTIIGTIFLVNFSLVIASLVIILMNAITNQFFDKVLFSNLTEEFYSVNGKTLGAAFFTALIGFIFVLLYVYLYLLLWVRVIMLHILFMFAAIPYIANVIPVPEVKEAVGFWWGEFFKWAFMGPMVAILLYVATKAAKAATSFSPVGGEVLQGDIATQATNFLGLIMFSVVLYIAATKPLKLGGEIMGKAQGYLSGKKGGGANPMTHARKYGETSIKTAKEIAGAKIKDRWMGAAAAGLERGSAATFGQKFAAMATRRAKAPGELLKSKVSDANKAASDYEKAYEEIDPNIKPKDIEDKAKESIDSSVESLRNTALTAKSAKKRATALKALQMKRDKNKGTKIETDATEAFNDVIARNNLGTSVKANGSIDVDSGFVQKMKTAGTFDTRISSASDPAELEKRLATASATDMQNFDPLAMDSTRKQQVSDLLAGNLSVANVNTVRDTFLTTAGIAGADADEVRDVMKSGNKKAIDKILEDKLGAAGFAAIQAAGSTNGYDDAIKKTVARANIQQVSGKLAGQNRISSANHLKDVVNNGMATGRTAADIQTDLESQITAINAATGTDKFDLAKRYFAPSYVGRTSATDDEIKTHMESLKRAIKEGTDPTTGTVDPIKISEYITKINPPKVAT